MNKRIVIIFQKLKNEQLLKDKELVDNHNDSGVIEEVLRMAEDQNQCNLLSIGVDETIKAIKAKIIRYVLLTHGAFKYVIKKKSKPIKFVANDNELHETTKNMNINLNKKNKIYKIVGFMEYMINLCKINNIELKQVPNDCEIGKKFVNDYSGCIGVLYQSLDYYSI